MADPTMAPDTFRLDVMTVMLRFGVLRLEIGNLTK